MLDSVLITGGSGFLGRALAKELLETDASRICVFSRGEFAQAQMRAAIPDPQGRLRWLIGDVRDKARLYRAMQGIDVVIHAAALKRVEAVEGNIMESVATNIIGTQNVVNAALDSKVRKAVLISTDKACAPSTSYGMSKAIAERLFLQGQAYAGSKDLKLIACRYGNVWKSTGSVVTIWNQILAADAAAKVPMTNPDCTRFFMTIRQAVELVLKAILEGEAGELFTPSLPAYDLRSLATAMGATGFREMALSAGEKLHERMTINGPDSSEVRRMSVEELREALAHA